MANEIQSAFDAAFADGAVGSPRPPPKSQIRGIGSVIQAFADDVNDQVTSYGPQISSLTSTTASLSSQVGSLNATVSSLQSSQNADAIGVATLAALNAITNKPVNTIGRVYQDPTASNNGDYRWTGSAWSYLGLDRIGKVEAATGAPLCNFFRPLVFDWDGAIGPEQTLYVPRALYARFGSTILSGTYGTASTALADYVALSISDEDLAVAYLDLSDATSPQKITNWTTLPNATRPNEIAVIAEIRNRTIATKHPVLLPNELYKGKVTFRYPLVVDGDVLLVSPFYHFTRTTGFDFYTPSDGSYFWSLPLSTTTSTEARYYFDPVAAAAGLTPVKVSLGDTQPAAIGSDLLVEFGRSLNRILKTDHPVSGAVAGGTVPNLFSRGNNPDRAKLYSSSATLVNITNSDLVALGFTRGVSGDEAYYGAALPEDTPLSGYFFARLYVEASADDTWQAPRLYLLDENGSTQRMVGLALEKRISARAAVFYATGQYTATNRLASFNIGTFQSVTTPVKVCGAQVYAGEKAYGSIARGNYPIGRDGDILYGPKHFAVTGRELPFFVENMVAEREISEKFRMVISKDAATPGTLPYVQSSRDILKLDYATATGSLTASVSGEPYAAGRRYKRNFSVARSAATVTGSPKVLAIGDSITNRFFMNRLSASLTAIGMTPSFIGTIDNSGVNGEGREAWEWIDYIYSETQFAPVAAGDESIYLARSNAGDGQPATGRWNFNPFLKAASPGAGVFNGYKFDLNWYLTRFGLASPDYVLINLGTNDLSQERGAAALAQVQAGLEVIIPNIRAARPSAKIGIGLPTIPRSTLSDYKWRYEQVPAIKLILSYVSGLADSNIDVLPYWAHMSAISGWTTTTDYSEGGMDVARVSDDLHPIGLNRDLMAEVAAQWIACRVAGL